MGGHRSLLMVMVWVWVQIRRKMLGYAGLSSDLVKFMNSNTNLIPCSSLLCAMNSRILRGHVTPQRVCGCFDKLCGRFNNFLYLIGKLHYTIRPCLHYTKISHLLCMVLISKPCTILQNLKIGEGWNFYWVILHSCIHAHLSFLPRTSLCVLGVCIVHNLFWWVWRGLLYPSFQLVALTLETFSQH